MTLHEGSDDRAVDREPRGGAEELPSEEELAEEVRELVAEEAPRVFALVQEHGERDNAWVFAWGLAFANHVEIISVNSGLRVTVKSVERVQRVFSRRRKIRLVWTDPTTVRQPEQITAITR